jgi:sarcosine/dimethylglycine N-methyltransferase
VTDIQIETQYTTGAARQAIEQALVAAGKDPGHLRPADLALLEDFHTMGRIATAELVDLVAIAAQDYVLDAGSGIGGTARYVAERGRCRVLAVDLTEEYCAIARWLNQLAGLGDRISVRQADVTDLPFADATFTLMFSQHVQMNVADKARLYAEARRVLVDGGRLAHWDIVAGGDREPGFPVPSADRPEYSHLTTSDGLRTAIEASGFEIEHWHDRTDDAAAMMQALLTLPPSPIGLQAFVPDFGRKAANLTAALADGRLRAVQGIARAVCDVWSSTFG